MTKKQGRRITEVKRKRSERLMRNRRELEEAKKKGRKKGEGEVGYWRAIF